MTSWSKAILGGIYDGLSSRATIGEAPAKIASGDINHGDVNIISILAFKADGDAKADLKEYVTELHIYESIVSPVIYCVLHVKDAVNFAETFRLAIGDIVQIIYQSPGAQQSEYLFQVNRPEINKRKIPSLALEVYAVELISVEGRAARNISMEGFNIKDTAGHLIEKVLKDHIQENTDVKKLDAIRTITPKRHDIDKGHGIIGKNLLQVTVLPNNSKGILRRPFEAIHQFALLNSKSPEGDSLYTFFERRDGYYFKPIEKLIRDGKKQIRDDQSDRLFYYDHLRNQDNSAIKFRNILAYNIISTDAIQGDVNSEGRTYNPDKGETSKNVKAEVDSKVAELTSAQAMKQFPVVTRSDFITSTEYDHLNEISTKRRQLLLRIGQYEAQIMIYGDSNLTVGEVIECNLPLSMSTAPGSSDPEQASSISKDAAPYLITHLRHIILNTDRPQHVMSCNLLRANAPRS